MTEQEETSAGGFEWEAGEALNMMTTGLIRLTQALRNASSSGSAAQLLPMLQGLAAIKIARQEDVASSEHALGMVIDQNEIEQAELGRHAARLALIDLKIQELVARLKAIEARE